ncbi:hypothetical protein SAMN02982929_02670 [Saccharopolyspora kobensis]|uniref:Uncharacterized protein n=1 Tax=Saccharopolyspora kobensis TaxID=146035 RepID=A0A1H6BKY8_9PSEU|nr:hypothetical protein SAMN02982929_02670 [Saccharopolyspora kobensis]SFE86803.1 hypothetical protein SAMN05216506_11595 [Saccharopolyspora kobensis]
MAQRPQRHWCDQDRSDSGEFTGPARLPGRAPHQRRSGGAHVACAPPLVGFCGQGRWNRSSTATAAPAAMIRLMKPNVSGRRNHTRP